MEFDEKEFEREIKKKVLMAMESKQGAQKLIEETLRELTDQLKEAKSEEDLKLIERKIDLLQDILEDMGEKESKEDVEELKEVLGTVSEYLPTIMDSIFNPIKDLLNDIYDPDKAEKLGKNVATFYKELVAAGMDPDKAFELTKEYMDSVNVIKTLAAAFMKKGMGGIEGINELKKLGKKKISVDFEEEL
ncbi:hypothetical protein PAP_06780 [Palaeococcus pacificus DY20341]|uniref:Uncharacterized protein n=1 Tax=Palaeococcus pacificus DY20341 TaxID=1343739 RepID=A0A075LUD8_9EURY|nr:hypothetical protein [Palaeococcus pacificus]AIF69751.1 hypothetical protein PAP_06780 [Palaeococcus pacificus DY20341]